MTSPHPTTPRYDFHPRLSLRALMLLVLVVGGGLGWWQAGRAREQRRRAIETTLRSSGASLSLDETRIDRIDWIGTTFNPAWLPLKVLTADQIRALGQCPVLHELSTTDMMVTDEVTTAIGRSSKLVDLYCFRPEVTDAGLAPLAQLKHLQTLQLIRASRLTDASLVPLGQIRSLRALTISGANLRGSEITQLMDLASLESLAIPENSLDDAGLAAIGRLTRLRQLSIGGESYTDAGMAHLASLTGLEEFGFGTPQCTAASLDTLANMDRLETLVIAGPTITDEWLDRLAARVQKTLRALSLDGPRNITHHAIERLRDAHPEIEIEVRRQQLYPRRGP